LTEPHEELPPEDPIALSEAEAARPPIVQIDKLVETWMAEAFDAYDGGERFAWAVGLLQFPTQFDQNNVPSAWASQLGVYVATPGHAGTTLMHNSQLMPHDASLTREAVHDMVQQIITGLMISRRRQPEEMMRAAAQASANGQMAPASGLILPGQVPAANGSGPMTFDDVEKLMRGGGR